MSRKIIGDWENGYMVSATLMLVCLSALAALTSMILPCICVVREWTPLFFVKYAFIEFFTSWGFILPFVKQLSGILGACLRRMRGSEQSLDLELGQSTSAWMLKFEMDMYISLTLFHCS